MFFRMWITAMKYKKGCMFVVNRIYAYNDIFVVKVEKEIEMLQTSIKKLENETGKINFFNKFFVAQTLSILKDCLAELESALDFIRSKKCQPQN